MGRLFDAGQREQDIKEQRDRREGVLERAEAVDRLLKEHLQLSEESDKLGEKIKGSEPQSVLTVKYTSYRSPGSKWKIEHAIVGDDYVYQLFPLRPPKMHWKDIALLFIRELDAIFPDSIHVRYCPPSERYELKYWTIRVEKIVNLPGWEAATRSRALEGLSSVDAWSLEQG